MSPELIDKLNNKHRLIFENIFPADVGDGWYNILDMLFTGIASHLKQLKENYVYEVRLGASNVDMPDETIRIMQIKEKFGSLRIYCSTVDLYMSGLVNMAELMSMVTCEECGNPGELKTTNGWVKCLCNEHRMAEALDAPASFMNDKSIM